MRLPVNNREARKRKRLSILFAFVLGFVTLAGSLASSATTRTQAAAPIAPKPAAPQSVNMKYGFYMALLGNNQVVANMSAQWVEYGIYWENSEPTPGNYNWGDVDNIVNSARTNGLSVLIRVSRPPQWARDAACSSIDTCPPRNPAEFGNFTYQLAAHARSLTPYGLAYEIWNEPNTSAEWGNLCPQPDRYANLLRAVYPQIKAADSSARVVAGSVTTVGEVMAPSECHMDDITFLQGMYSAGAQPYFDILSDHPYGFAYAPETSPTESGNRLVFRRAERHHDIMVQNGDGNKKIWATEMGWPVNPRSEGSSCAQPDWYFIFTQQQQADYMVRAYNWARSYWPWMDAMFAFNFDFNEAPWYDQCNAFRFWAVKNRLAQNAITNQIQHPPATYTAIPATPTTPVDAPPAITAVRYSTVQFSRLGGSLTVSLDANDPDSTAIDTVQAILTNPDNTTQVINFSLVLGNAQSGTWQATIPVPANGTQQQQTYTVAPYAIEQFPTRRTTFAPSQQIAVTNTRFVDVPADFWAYQYIESLADRNVIGGYADNTFRPGNSATRAQLTKITILGFNYPVNNPGPQRFADVPPDSPFYVYIDAAAGRSIIGGYPCGGQGEPCTAGNLPYFRPNNSVTRGQITKIIDLAAGWTVQTPGRATFADVAVGSPFFSFVETAAAHGILGGYACGGPGEPCDAQNRAYFRPNNTTTRAQISKMVYLAIADVEATPTAAPATSTPVPPTATPVPPNPTQTNTQTATATGTSTPFITTTPTPGLKVKP